MNATDRAFKSARRLRKTLSPPEVLLWQRLRGTQFRIRRQHPLGPFVLDFYCPAAKLAIEVDGVHHDFGDRPRRDEARTRYVESSGIELLRIPAKDILADADSVAEAVLRACEWRAQPLHHSASPSGPPPPASGAGRRN